MIKHEKDMWVVLPRFFARAKWDFTTGNKRHIMVTTNMCQIRFLPWDPGLELANLDDLFYCCMMISSSSSYLSPWSVGQATDMLMWCCTSGNKRHNVWRHHHCLSSYWLDFSLLHVTLCDANVCLTFLGQKRIFLTLGGTTTHVTLWDSPHPHHHPLTQISFCHCCSLSPPSQHKDIWQCLSDGFVMNQEGSKVL